jgi:DNA-binding NarL/FixJ family response regulator
MTNNKQTARKTLTGRERQIVRIVCQGVRNQVIADQLQISVFTVRNHLKSVMRKLDVEDRFELAVTAWRSGLAPWPKELRAAVRKGKRSTKCQSFPM